MNKMRKYECLLKKIQLSSCAHIIHNMKPDFYLVY